MPVVIIIEKNGSVKELAMKTILEEDFFKRAGFKSPTDFKLHTIFNYSNYNIRLYGKIKGKANQENKYEFPPPVDTLLFFGSCLLVNTTDDGEIINLSKKEWVEVYDKLFGGFEDIENNSEDDEEDSEEGEDENILIENLTKEGYMKDGFIVDDDNSEIMSESGSEIEFQTTLKSVPKSKKIKPLKKVPILKSAKTTKKSKIIMEENTSFLECKEELEEEEYFK